MRNSGVLLHITSLPSPYGVGTLGREAYEFIDFLKAAKQSCWQILPLNPTGFGNSPYQSFSAFAGNPYMIDFDLLCGDGLLTQDEFSEIDWAVDGAATLIPLITANFILTAPPCSEPPAQDLKKMMNMPNSAPKTPFGSMIMLSLWL